jgi:segregation and condensation protein A
MTGDANSDGVEPDDVKPDDANSDGAKPDDVKPDDVPFAEDPAVDRGTGEPTLIVDVGGFEGPLDLLLLLARQQKVDLAKISILALADQYLAFVEQARRTRLELAADYLVMAAWLAYLKSRMLLPEPAAPEGMSAADMAKALALRLQRLEAIRQAGTKLFERPLLGRDVFGRGDPQPIAEIKRPEWSATLYDLLSAYAAERQRRALARVRLAKRVVWSLADARIMLERLVGTSSSEWGRLDEYLLAYAVEPAMRATVLASSFAATLELVREGAMEVHQSAAFAPIYLRKRLAAGGDGAAAAP